MQTDLKSYSYNSYDPEERAAVRRRSLAHMKEMRRKRIVRNALVIALMILAFCSGFFGRGLLSVHAEENIASVPDCYYGSIQIKRGDSLWDIAETYSRNSGYNTREYVDELMRLNKLSSEDIHAGQYLTVIYYE